MRCRGRCFSIHDAYYGKTVIHDTPSSHGITYGSPQPLCGECAVLFFDKADFAIWVRQYDVPAVMSNAEQRVSEATAKVHDFLVGTEEHLLPSDEISWDIATEIPNEDDTYLSVGLTLIPHTRISKLFLLEYRTFQGAWAYQPCSGDRDIVALFARLRRLDGCADPVFQEAREWSCVTQAHEGLPKELR
ncbi:hypothetical protein RJ55_01844 [Drechmeria coniospora]|nr:hypothetical protein RJ55_01844 [Drechmeria coniospora]